MDDAAGGSREDGPSGDTASRSLLDRLAPDSEPPPDSIRGRFWSVVCDFAHYFYVLLLVVTVFAVMNLLVLALVPSSSLSPGAEEGSLVVIVLNFLFLGATALGIAYVLWRCKQLRTSR